MGVGGNHGLKKATLLVLFALLAAPALAQLKLGASTDNLLEPEKAFRFSARALELGVALGGRLDEQRMLFVVLQRAFPAVHRAAGREDVDAGREPLLDERIGDALGRGAVRQIGEHQQRGHP